MLRIMIIGLVSIVLSACGLANRINAERDMTTSKKVYQACLAQHPNEVATCDSTRLTYEADLQTYQALNANRPQAVYVSNFH
ncbi:MAG: hypothetical protein WAW86_10715 [Gammaproteobacteria bacterium]